MTPLLLLLCAMPAHARAPLPTYTFVPGPAAPRPGRAEGQYVASGIQLRLYEAGLDFLATHGPSFLPENPIADSFADIPASGGSNSCWDYGTGMRNVSFNVPVEADDIHLDFVNGGKVGGTFDIGFDAYGTAYAWANKKHWYCVSGASASADVEAHDATGDFLVTLAVVDEQLVVVSVDQFNLEIGSFDVDLGLLDSILDLVGLDDNLDRWIRDQITAYVEDTLRDMVPELVTDLLRDQLNLTGAFLGFDYRVRPEWFAAGDGSGTLGFGAGVDPDAFSDCVPDQPEPPWPAPAGALDPVHPGAHAAVALADSVMDDGLHAAWASGLLCIQRTFDVGELLAGVSTAFPASGTVDVDVYSTQAPTVLLPASGVFEDGPQILMRGVQAHLAITTPTGPGPELDVSADVIAKGLLYIDEANVVTLLLTEIDFEDASISYGGTTAELEPEDESTLINDVLLPLYRDNFGAIPLTTSVFSFAGAAIRIQELQVSQDYLNIYLELAAPPPDDATAPNTVIDTVNGSPLLATSVVSGVPDVTLHYLGTDNYAALVPYLTFETRVDGGEWQVRNYLKTVQITLDDGEHTFEVRATDLAGNLDLTPASVTVVIDSSAPETVITAGPLGFIADATPLFEFATADGAPSPTFRTRVDGGAWTGFSGVMSAITATLASGPHVFEVAARDNLGREDETPAARSFIVDLDPPDTAFSGDLPTWVSASFAEFSYYGTDALADELSFSARLLGDSCGDSWSEFDVAMSASYRDCELADGEYFLEVRARDQAGNVDPTPAQHGFRVDSEAPETTLVVRPLAQTTDPDLEFQFFGADNMADNEELWYEWRMPGYAEVWQPLSGAPRLFLDGVPSGTYRFEVRAVDLAGNFDATPASAAFVLDSGAPETVIVDGPDAFTANTSLGFLIEGEDDLSPLDDLEYSYSTDGGESWSAFSGNGHVELEDVPEGLVRFLARARDAFGNTDATPAERYVAIDRTPPETTLEDGPSGDRNEPAVVVTVTASDNHSPPSGMRFAYRVALLGESQSEWTEPRNDAVIELDGLEAGQYRVSVRAIDQAGNFDETPLILEFGVGSTGSGDGGGGATPADEGGCATTSPSGFALFLLMGLLARRRR